MITLDHKDVYWCVRRLPDKVRDILMTYERAVVAGGFIRSCVSGEAVSDVDVFSPDKEYADNAALQLDRITPRGSIVETPNATTVYGGQLPVQFIHRWTYSKPEDVVESFDFTCCCAALWYANGEWKSLADDKFYVDLAAKRLVYRSPLRNEDAGGSMLRVLKFYQRGYRIPIESLGGVIARLAKAVDWGIVRDDTESARVISGLLREVDPSIEVSGMAYIEDAPEGDVDV